MTRACVAGLAALAVVACAAESGEPRAEASAGGGVPIVVPDTAADSAGVGADSAIVDDGPDLPPMPGEGELRDFRLLLVNPHGREARVFASAGAVRVALDTVPAGDSVRVDVRVRADRIRLEAEDAGGAAIGSLELELEPGEINRWEIGPPPGPRVAAGKTGSGVARGVVAGAAGRGRTADPGRRDRAGRPHGPIAVAPRL